MYFRKLNTHPSKVFADLIHFTMISASDILNIMYTVQSRSRSTWLTYNM